MNESYEDIFNDALSFIGESKVLDESEISYGPLRLTVAPKEGKANTLLADHLFSPSLFLAERIERALISVQGSRVVELGAGCALPSLLMSTLPQPPSLVVVTDYPDGGIMENLKENIDRNRAHVSDGCITCCQGYEWGTDAHSLLSLTGSEAMGYDVVILSDLLHFNSSHNLLIASLKSLLRKSADSRVYIAAGRYTSPDVCDNFMKIASCEGFSINEELCPDGQDEPWLGVMEVASFDKQALSVRKAACRFWIGRWAA
ncbi:uncharacterized protein BT62DRAFT_1056156 [Guyanagaster necrorhizus]|uniref:Uncharacterized protein n=1 Tax=Guyanagaster necrorhizus TaxID=856835 RepID=A0A9P7VVU8_9AGAR|nr:uncharacterized protein BT62DRAFT_1056156 [Guyanagaster necrorhizus MCA 3950]KAG7448471.1 hypothetical protein BT62DRAFT_1056156 [Guyanagaster necrorhizus MCA 3950]